MQRPKSSKIFGPCQKEDFKILKRKNFPFNVRIGIRISRKPYLVNSMPIENTPKNLLIATSNKLKSAANRSETTSIFIDLSSETSE